VLAPFSAHGSPVSSRVHRGCPASREPHSSPFCTPCSPSPCTGHYSGHLSTMGTPSPCVSRRVGDPVFACVRRYSVLQVSISSPSTSSLEVTHHRERSVDAACLNVLPYLRLVSTHCGVTASGMLRRASSFTVGDLDSTNPGLTIHTGLAGQLRYIPSRFPALPPCYFPLGVSSPGRAVALEGLLLSTFCLSEAISRMPKRRTVANRIFLTVPASKVGLG